MRCCPEDQRHDFDDGVINSINASTQDGSSKYVGHSGAVCALVQDPVAG